MDDAPLVDPVAEAAARAPQAPALVLDGGAELTYAALDDAVTARAMDLDLVPGERLVIPARRDLATVLTLWAVWRSSAVAVPVDPELRTPHLPDPPEGTTGVAFAAEAHTWLLTSGSTGTPRPVVLTWGNVTAAVDASQRRIGNGPADRWLAVLPLFHAGGLMVLLRTAAAGGAVVLHESFHAGRVFGAMAAGDVTVASVVPTMLHRMVRHGGAGNGTERVRAVLVGGAASGAELVEQALDMGIPALITYGMTETASQVATVVPGEERESLGTVGRPLAGLSVTVDGGIVTVDGPAVSPGYAYERPRTGPLVTADRGRFDAAGRLVVSGRADDVVVTGGENVDPAVVEAALMSVPGVNGAVVFGAPDDEWGAIVTAVVATDGAVTEANLAAHAGAVLRPAEVPRRWLLVASLPRLATGKLDRRSVIETYSGSA